MMTVLGSIKGTPPPRLFVIMAKKAPVAVVIRRGPSLWVRLTLWHTQKDAFTPGSWFHGRIFAEKCDLSPDGELFLYAAYKGTRLSTSYSGSWTAISRPPWFHALALWPMHTTYGGGGRFVGERQVILRGATVAHPAHLPRGVTIVSGDAPYQRSTNEVEGADWTGRDQRSRLVYASSGRVFARTGGRDLELADFNDERPDPQPPPVQARRTIG
jgi:hypothetical protein